MRPVSQMTTAWERRVTKILPGQSDHLKVSGLWHCISLMSNMKHPLQDSSLAFSPHNAMMKVKRLGHAVQMRYSRQYNKNMEYLVRAAPDIESARRHSFGESSLFLKVSKRSH